MGKKKRKNSIDFLKSKKNVFPIGDWMALQKVIYAAKDHDLHLNWESSIFIYISFEANNRSILSFAIIPCNSVLRCRWNKKFSVRKCKITILM